MSVSDILTILSIAIAILSISYASDRKIWLYKFSKWDCCICALWFVITNYFIFFDFFHAHGWYFPELMRTDGFYLRPKTWAYLTTIVSVIYFVCKIYANRFPRSRYKALTDYYLTLINTNFFLLMNYLHEFHEKKLEKYIHAFNQAIEKRIKAQKDEPEFDGLFADSEKSEDDAPSLSGLILSKIIFNPIFINESVRQQPVAFLDFVHGLKYSDIEGSQELVESYYRQLISRRNVCLTEGLNRTENFVSTGELGNTAYRLTDSHFAQLTFENLAFTCRMKVWHAFGEEGLKDACTNNFFGQEVNEWRDAQYHVTPARICLKFYDIFIRELTNHWYKDQEEEAEFIYLHYLYMIGRGVWANFHGDLNDLNKSYVKKLFDDILSNMRDWLSCMERHNRLQHQSEILNIIKCIITLDDYPETLRVEAAKWLLETILDLSRERNIAESFVDTYLNEIRDVKSRNSNEYLLAGWNGINRIVYPHIPLYNQLDSLIHQE